jgi:AraC-like DNA-binding protein
MTVSILMVRVLIQAVERAGGSRGQLLAAAGIDPRWLDDCNRRLSTANYDRVQLAALEASGDEALGLHMGELTSSSAFDVLGHLKEHAATLRQGIETILRYQPILGAAQKCVLSEEGKTASIRYALPSGASRSIRLPAELAMSGLLRLIRLFVGPAARLRCVFFDYKAPAYHAEYRRIFGGVERFGHTFTGIEFERSWLDCTQLHKNTELFTVLTSQAERTLGRLERDAGLAELVKEHLCRCDPGHAPTMDQVARHFGMSVRSLRRRLLLENFAFNDLVEHASTNVAKRMLEDPRSSIDETSYAMGFATPAAFQRAFKRWSGMTPRAYKTSLSAPVIRRQ